MSSPDSAPRRRNPVLVGLDVAVSAVVFVFALVFGLTLLTFVNQLTEAAATCVDDAALQCDPVLLTNTSYLLLGITVLGFFLGLGFGIVRALRRRYMFPWAFGTIAVLILGFYLAAWLAGQGVPGA